MKIISNFKDYYDHHAFVYGLDETRVWKRLSESDIQDTVKLSTYEFKPDRKNHLERRLYVELMDVWFCDKNYPLLFVYFGARYSPEQAYYFWSLESFVSAYKKYKCIPEWNLQAIRDHFTLSSDRKLNTLCDCPQLLHYGDKIDKNIKLKDYGFQHIVPSEQAFQKISMWLNSTPDVPQTIPTDLDRFEARGFDRKSSFRNV